MKTLETARNVINSEEVETWLKHRFGERYPTLVLWIGSVVRKFVVKKASTRPANLLDEANLPAWLRTAMQQGGEPPEEVILDDALANRIQPVLDYMVELVNDKPDTNVAAIGFEVAEQRSIKWHEKMTQTVVPVVVEDGANIMKTYPDGYTWRTVVGKDAMVREGDRMGHCVGRFNYHQMVLRAKAEIVSLRDGQNEPHVTIEIGEGGQRIQQIKGRANKAVVAKYLPYVEDFLKSRTWASINFDGAEPLRDSVTTFQVFQGKPWFEHGNLRAGLKPSGYDSSYQQFVLATKTHDIEIGKFTLSRVNGLWLLDTLSVLDTAGKADFFLAMCLAKNITAMQQGAVGTLLGSTSEWTKSEGWCAAKNQAAKDYLQITVGTADAQVCLDSKQIIAWYNPANTSLYLSEDLDNETRQAVALQLNVAATVYTQRGFVQTAESKSDINFSSWLKKMLTGRSIVTDTDESLLNSLLAALKQPDAAAIKAGYMQLKNKAKIVDADFKSLGFATGGRAINAIGTVLLCSLPIKNTAPFRSYIFHKPNTMNCWLEVLAQPDHLHTALVGYGIGASTIKQILELLRNEFLRLIPTEAEIEELDLEAGVAQKVKMALKYAKTHKQNAARSKALWAQL